MIWSAFQTCVNSHTVVCIGLRAKDKKRAIFEEQGGE